MGFDREWSFRNCPWCGLQETMFQFSQENLVTSTQSGRARFWALGGCPRCAGPVLLETNAREALPHELLRTIPDTPSGEVQHLPLDVAEFYDGAQRVLSAGVPDAAAVELRKTLEAAAAYFGFEDARLVDRIKQLIAAGLITVPFGDVLDHVRKVGNVGAHASDDKVDSETAQRAYRFTTQVLRNLFEIPAELQAIGQPSVEDQAAAEDETPPT
jgi:uncharacterized protein DUF4145